MKFTPKTDAEIAEEQAKFKPLKGIFDFEVTEASDEISNAGNDMIKVVIGVWRPDGSQVLIKDYLLAAMAFKFKHFCEATGMLDRYEAGDVNAGDCLGKTGQVELKIKKVEDKEYSEVKDYIKRIASAQNAQPPKGLIGEGKPLDDEIPF